MPSKTVAFYDRYHIQNAKNTKIITRNNITYWHIIRLIEKASKDLNDKKILDIGCGVGSLSFYLSHHGAVVLGIDVSERAIALAKYTQIQTKSSSVKFIQSSLSGTGDSNAPTKQIPSGFDMILCTEVIEHIKNDSQLLSDCNSKLRKDGKLILTTQRNDGLLYKLGYFSRHDRLVGHVRRYDPEKLVKLIEQNGFKIELKQDADGLLRSVFYTTKLGIILKFIRGPLIPLFQWLDLQSIKFFGAADIQIVAVKL